MNRENNIIRLTKSVEETTVFNAIESKYSICISDDTKNILKRYSRGVPNNKEFLINGKNFMLSCFLSVNDRDKINLASVADRLHEYLNSITFIPFATDGFGNYYGMIFDGGELNDISFYNAEQGSFVHVCTSIQQIIAALCLK